MKIFFSKDENFFVRMKIFLLGWKKILGDEKKGTRPTERDAVAFTCPTIRADNGNSRSSGKLIFFGWRGKQQNPFSRKEKNGERPNVSSEDRYADAVPNIVPPRKISIISIGSAQTRCGRVSSAQIRLQLKCLWMTRLKWISLSQTENATNTPLTLASHSSDELFFYLFKISKMGHFKDIKNHRNQGYIDKIIYMTRKETKR